MTADDRSLAASASTREIGEAFVQTFGPDRVGHGVGLGRFTTFRTGGSADWLLDTRHGREVTRALSLAAELGLPVTLLGGGSNVLVGEGGVRGLVIRLWHGEIELVRPGVVRADAGVTLNGLVRWTASRGLAGLERWAGTPGTVGGALHGNAHFQGHLIGDQLTAAGLSDREGVERQASAAELELGYDTSRLQQSGEAVLWAEFAVGAGDPIALRATARASLAYRKQTQPLTVASAGCIFQNPNRTRDRVPVGLPVSAGALVDLVGLKGASIGGARVSPLHGNFIVSDGQATPSEIRLLIERCRETVHRELGVVLRDEIVYLGKFASGPCM